MFEKNSVWKNELFFTYEIQYEVVILLHHM